VKGAKRGVFVTFEGADGTGKTTQVNLLREHLDSKGIPYLFLREPGSTELGEELRETLLHKTDLNLTPEAEALLYAAARSQLVHKRLLPTLEQGVPVLCDRYIDSSIAYQVFGMGVCETFVQQINRVAVEEAMPDLTVLFQLPTGGRHGGPDRLDRIELRGVGFQERVQRGYLELARRNPDRIVVVDASQSIANVHEEVKEAVMKQLRPT
jgi:dTMP kinase